MVNQFYFIFTAACKDIRKDEIDKEIVEKVFHLTHYIYVYIYIFRGTKQKMLRLFRAK